MEKQLADYRAKKAKEKAELPNPSAFGVIKRLIYKDGASNKIPSPDITAASDARPTAKPTEPVTYNYSCKLSESPDPHPRLRLSLKIILWIILWGLFIEIGFGAVYFCVSLLCIIYYTMRADSSRNSGAPSAYSVFNPNCERLDGTFTAEQFEKELRHGAGSVH
ncbi:hypothetical protein CAPTEDRAFT_187956 [Capitella teleta]|uniref:SAYSvFN domain-containing protein n=1 Tax=Capitella teleta TaxID=283909 RepID=R7U453_CAPTE|nr:hypothetical protein CAPTEDRAFT_187956 [Capitella teleta]|eukprot:ELU01130.1 hypothetical protein CAPTEDRAFT_187956 [Capitella teleta]